MSKTKTDELTTKERAEAAGARVPADRAAKAEANGDVHHVTVRGFNLEFEQDDLDDYDAYEAFHNGAPRRMLMLLAGDQMQDILASMRVDGRLRNSAVVEFVGEVFEAVGQGKS